MLTEVSRMKSDWSIKIHSNMFWLYMYNPILRNTFLVLETSPEYSTGGDTAWLMSEVFDPTSEMCLTFFYHMFGQRVADLSVYIAIDKQVYLYIFFGIPDGFVWFMLVFMVFLIGCVMCTKVIACDTRFWYFWIYSPDYCEIHCKFSHRQCPFWTVQATLDLKGPIWKMSGDKGDYWLPAAVNVSADEPFMLVFEGITGEGGYTGSVLIYYNTSWYA